MTVYISLLRGINVGGHKKIRMADLKALYESLGLRGAQTLLQSGNVVFETDSSADLAPRLEAAIEQAFGFPSKIVLRTCDELRAVIQAHPFSAEQMAEPDKVVVMFFVDTPDAAPLLQTHTGPEKLYPQGRELYIFYTDGIGRSKLDNALIERRLKAAGTARNWNTVTKLLALAETVGG